MRSYRPEELFDGDGRLVQRLQALAPRGDRRMSASPHTNGGLLLRDLVLPDFRELRRGGRRARQRRSPSRRGCWASWSATSCAPTRTTFRLMGPDETSSNRLSAVFEATDRAWIAERLPG